MLSIITVNYKSSKDIYKCLESIVRYEKNYRDYEFIIVDNNSADPGLNDIKNNFQFVKIILASKNGGFAYGNNIGIKNSTGDYIFLLNPDTYIVDNSIEKLYAKIANSPDIAIIGPQLLKIDKSNQSYLAPKSYLTLWRLFCEQLFLHKIFKNIKFINSYMRSYMNYNEETFVEQVSGAAFMFRRNILNSIGMLDENYFMYFEESDFCLQALRNNLKLYYYPVSKIIHTHAAGIFSERSIKDITKSFKYYFKKNFSKIDYYPAIVLYVIGSFIRLFGCLIHLDNRYKSYIYYLKYLVKN